MSDIRNPNSSNSEPNSISPPNNKLFLGNTRTNNAFNDFGITVRQFADNKIKKFATDEIYIWDIYTNQSIRQPRNQGNQPEKIASVWFFDNYTITYSYDYNVDTDETTYILKIWDSNLDNCLHTLTGHTCGIYSVIIHNNCLHTLTGHTGGIYSVIIHNNLLISGSEDTTIRIWDITTGSCLKTLLGHTELVDNLTARDNLLISSSEDETVKIWDITTASCISTFECEDTYVWSLCMSNNTVVLGMENGTIQLWDIPTATGDSNTTTSNTTRKNIRKLDANNTIYSRTGIKSIYANDNLIISSDDEGYIKFWDMNSLELIKEYKNDYKISDIKMSDNILILNANSCKVILMPITLFPGEYDQISGALDKYNLVPYLEREIMAFYNAI